ncbi:hypothetical protein G5I_09146 [Acromyrmex echinatior]|uniref:THAP-type domain-containing protein n=1 Tax=Acromyrmex echinatior TaxID=103372 RepID=F4WTB7_ACREC|nr:hypothetical protein G5I_09146 [Acromyrmex echinatior]
MVGYCRICKIGVGEEIDVSIHRMPKDEKIKAIWFEFIGRELGPNSGICSKHFKQSDFIYKTYGNGVRRFLKQGACPSILHVSNIRKNIEFSGNISSRTERDTDPEKNIIIKEEQECIIDETVINTENSMDIQFNSITFEAFTDIFFRDVKEFADYRGVVIYWLTLTLCEPCLSFHQGVFFKQHERFVKL